MVGCVKIISIRFTQYIKAFMEHYPLNYYDLKYMPFIYLLELARTVYGYSQYLETALECHLDFANELYNQCICLENYADELSNKLLSLIDMIL